MSTLERPAGRKRTDAQAATRAITEYCTTLAPGDRLPTLPQLMERFEASERAVLTALEELRRGGKIVRRNGVGTFVTGAGDESPVPLSRPAAGVETAIVAVTRRDHSYFDRCLSLLSHLAEDAGLTLTSRSLAQGANLDVDDLPAGEDTVYLFFQRQFAPLARQMVARGRRAVLFGMPAGHEPVGCPNVYGDRSQGELRLRHYLRDLGHRRFAFFPWDDQALAMEAAQAIGRDCTGTGISLATATRWRQHPGEAADFFRGPESPTALVAWNDHNAIHMLGLLSRAGIEAPREVSIAGYDNLPEGALMHPALATVDGDILQQLKATLEILTAPTPAPNNRSVVIAPNLVPRESTAPPPR